MKNTKTVLTIFLITTAFLFSGLFIFTNQTTEAILEGTTGVQVSGGGNEGDPCSNRTGSDTDVASSVDCGGGGGSSVPTTTTTPKPKPRDEIIMKKEASGSVTVNVIPLGGTNSLIGTPCFIEKNKNTCTTDLTLNIINPVPGADTNITKPVNQVVATGITPLKKTGIIVDYPSTSFFLNHNGSTLASTQVSASCRSGYIWDGLRCVEGSISFGCSDGILNQDETSIDTGGVCATGSLTIPSSCQIGKDESSCTVTGAVWNTTKTTNPVSLIDVNMGRRLSDLTNNLNPLKVWVGYPHTVFNLKDNTKILDSKIVTASCKPGTKWNGGKCILVDDGSGNGGNGNGGGGNGGSTTGGDGGNGSTTGGDGGTSGGGNIVTCSENCPTVTIIATRNGREISENEKIPYNSKIMIRWEGPGLISCNCEYIDSKNNTGTCGSGDPNNSNPEKTFALKRDTKFTVSCFADYRMTVLDEVKVLIQKIETKYEEI